MSKYFTFVLMFFSLSLAQAQIEMKEGPKTKRRLFDGHVGFLLADSLHVFSVDNNQQGNPSVEVYSAETLYFVRNFKLKDEEDLANNAHLSHVFSLQNTICTVFEQKSKNGFTKIYLKKRQLQGNLIHTFILDSIPANEDNMDYQILVNLEETAFLYVKQNVLQANPQQSAELKAFDTSNALIWSQTIFFPDRDKQYAFSKWQFSGQEEVTFLARPILDLFKPDIAFSSAESNTYVLFNYNHANDKLKEIEIRLHNRYIGKIDFDKSDSGIIVSGIYSIDRNFNPDGIFNILFDADFQKNSHHIHDFTVREIGLLRSQKKESMGKKVSNQFQKDYVNDFLLQDILRLKKGGFVVIAEEYRKEWEEEMPNANNARAPSSSNLYFHQNILFFWFDESGELKSSNNIEKNQLSNTEMNTKSSFKAIEHDDNLFVFYNDNPKNMELSQLDNKMSKSNKKKILKCVKINDKSKSTVYSSSTYPGQKGTMVLSGEQLQDRKVYFNTTKGWFKRSILQFSFPK